MRSERSKREGDERHTVLEWGLANVMIFGATIIQGERDAESPDKGSQTLSYGPVRVLTL